MIRCWLGIHRWCQKYADHGVHGVYWRHCILCGRLQAGFVPNPFKMELGSIAWRRFAHRHYFYDFKDPLKNSLAELNRRPLTAFYHLWSNRLAKLRNRLLCRD